VGGKSDETDYNQRSKFIDEMSPRNYDMSKRAAAVARTRQRIVDATRQLHGERGIAATSWDDIAARAGVGVGTVYRHFPTLDDLIPACGTVTMALLDLPHPSAVPARFEGVAQPTQRIQLLVCEAFSIYERGAPELRAIRRESGIHPDVARAGEDLELALGALVDTALQPLDTTPEDRAVARAMVDLNTWDALRQQGVGLAEAVAVISDMLATRLVSRHKRTLREGQNATD